jgi:hypothetical protein
VHTHCRMIGSEIKNIAYPWFYNRTLIGFVRGKTKRFSAVGHVKYMRASLVHICNVYRLCICCRYCPCKQINSPANLRKSYIDWGPITNLLYAAINYLRSYLDEGFIRSGHTDA